MKTTHPNISIQLFLLLFIFFHPLSLLRHVYVMFKYFDRLRNLLLLAKRCFFDRNWMKKPPLKLRTIMELLLTLLNWFFYKPESVIQTLCYFMFIITHICQKSLIFVKELLYWKDNLTLFILYIFWAKFANYLDDFFMLMKEFNSKVLVSVNKQIYMVFDEELQIEKVCSKKE